MIDFEKMMGSAEGAGVDRRAFANFLTQVILDDPEVPESMKISLRIMKEGEKLADKIMNLSLRFSIPDTNIDAAEAKLAVRREALEYIRLVSAGVDTFMEAQPELTSE